jgi:chromosomal replication initiator protein
MEQAYNTGIQSENNIYEKLNIFLQTKLKNKIGVRNYLLWFKNVVFLPKKDVLAVVCNDEKNANIIYEKYMFTLTQITNETWKGKNVVVKIYFSTSNSVFEQFCDDVFTYSDVFDKLCNEQQILELRNSNNSVFLEKPNSEVIYFNEKNYNKTFKNFITSEDNIMAYEICQSISCANEKELVQSGSIVALYGETSVGKTHLLDSIQNFYQSAGGKVLYLTASNFLREYVNSVQKQLSFSFYDNILANEIILIDNIDDLIGKSGTLQALKQVFTLAVERQRFVVISSKLTPTLLFEKSNTLKDILSTSITVKIPKQDNDLKTKIAINYIAEHNLNVPISIVRDLILRLNCNIRELKNYIKKLAIVQSIRKFELNLTLALEILQDDITVKKENVKRISNEEIVRFVAEYYKTTADVLKSKIKTTDVCRARNIAILMMRTKNSANLQEIGCVLNRTHGSIIASLKTIESLLDIDKKLPAELADLRAIIG